MKKLTLSIFVILIIISPAASSAGEIHLAGRLEGHVSFLAADSLEGRGLGTRGKILAKEYIAAQFAQAGLIPYGDDYYQHLDLRIGLARVPASNVIGYLPATDARFKDQYILIGAHYDHLGYDYTEGERVIFPGADDNASGTAVMLELARYFASDASARGRGLIFIAFDAEESGLLGAQRFIEDNTVFALDEIQLMFSLDMLGMYEANRGVHLLGMGTLDGGKEVARRVASAGDISLRRLTSEVAMRTDTWPFGQEGIPSVHAFTGTRSPYHKPTDTYDLLDYEGMARITLYLQDLVTDLSKQESLNPSSELESLQDPSGLRLTAGAMLHLGGSHHRYPDEFFRAGNVFAGGMGFFLKLQTGHRLAFQPELLYDYNGSKSPEGTYRRHSLTVPFNVHFTLGGDPMQMVRLYPIAGAYYSYHFSGSDGDADLGFGDLHPDHEWGISAGFGLEVMRFQIGYTWRRGLTGLSPTDETDIFSTGRYFSIGYRL